MPAQVLAHFTNPSWYCGEPDARVPESRRATRERIQMSSFLKRWLAVGTAAAVTLLGAVASTPAASAEMKDVATNRAANYVATHLPSKSSVSGNATAALALATTGQCTYAAPLRTIVHRLQDRTAKYIKKNPAGAAKLALVAESLGLNPKKFGKRNLLSAITKGLPSDGTISPYPFAQALGIVSLKRAGTAVPASMVTRLLGMQNANGSFGTNDAAADSVGDPDSTAVAIQALAAVGGHQAAVDKALAWADANQTAAGYWKAYSPVDSTGLLGSVSGLASSTTTKAHAWLLTQQLSSGGFPNTLSGSSANVMATADALWLLSGTDLSTSFLKLSSCGSTPPKLPKATTSCAGVWVVVDRGNGQYTTRCAKKYSTGVVALRSAGFAVKTFTTSFGASICRVTKFPAKCDTTFASGYWSYWTSTRKADGTWSDWGYASTGPATSSPAKGTAEAHLWVAGSIPWDASPAPVPAVSAPIGYASSPVPVISGTTKVGQKLRVTTGAWSPMPPKLKIRWYRNGHAIKHATATTYTLRKADRRKRISVKVTASGAGYQTLSRVSVKTAKVTR